MSNLSDTYITIAGQAEALSKDKGSKFMSFAYHVENETEIKEYLDNLRKKYYDATHHCYAWRLGSKGDSFRAVDDGEPSSTAGKPILGQLLSHELTNILIVVVRYFGGTKLGVSGLIAAYKEAASEVIEVSVKEHRTIDAYIDIEFGYLVMNDVMRVTKEVQPEVIFSEFDNNCYMKLRIRKTREQTLIDKLSKIEGIKVDLKEYK